jgi:hypothetical protein
MNLRNLPGPEGLEVRVDMRKVSQNPPARHLLLEQVDSLISQVKTLFQEKLSQFCDPLINDLLSKKKIEELVKKLLASIAEIHMEDIRRIGAFAWKYPMKHGWYEMIMNLLLDLQKHNILPESLLSDFLNKETHGQLIWKYVNSRVYPSVPMLYLNFDLKLSLQEDPSTQKYRNIIQRQYYVWTKPRTSS